MWSECFESERDSVFFSQVMGPTHLSCFARIKEPQCYKKFSLSTIGMKDRWKILEHESQQALRGQRRTAAASQKKEKGIVKKPVWFRISITKNLSRKSSTTARCFASANIPEISCCRTRRSRTSCSVEKCRKLDQVHFWNLSRVVREWVASRGKFQKGVRHIFKRICRRQPLHEIIGRKSQKTHNDKPWSAYFSNGELFAEFGCVTRNSEAPLARLTVRRGYREISPTDCFSEKSSAGDEGAPKRKEEGEVEFELWLHAVQFISDRSATGWQKFVLLQSWLTWSTQDSLLMTTQIEFETLDAIIVKRIAKIIPQEFWRKIDLRTRSSTRKNVQMLTDRQIMHQFFFVIRSKKNKGTSNGIDRVARHWCVQR